MNAKWTAGGREKTTPVWVKDENGKTVCNVARCADDWNRASLISAAPDLLAALEAIVKMVGPYSGQGRMDAEIAAARSAIAKARGE